MTVQKNSGGELNRAVFIDRDGVINSDEGHYYIYRTEDVKINPGVVEGLRLLSEAGFLLVVVTNQGGVAKGIYSDQDVIEVHGLIRNYMKKEGVILTDLFYCPHHESVSACECRKPLPGMILAAIEKYRIDPKLSYLIGDSKRDVEAGQRAGLKQCFLIEPNSSILPVCNAIIGMRQAECID